MEKTQPDYSAASLWVIHQRPLIAGLFTALSLQPENVGEVVDVIRHERETAIATGLEPSNESPKLKHSVELRFRHSAYLN